MDTLEWSKKVFRVPVLDHWWQTGEHFPSMCINTAECSKTLQGREIQNSGHQAQTQDLGGSGFSKNAQFFGIPFVKTISANDIDDPHLLVPRCRVLKTSFASSPLCFAYIQ